MKPAHRVVLHLDMNAYFASVEQRADPALRGRPVAVVGDLSRRSVIMTASYEARSYGVRTGSLFHEARRLCPQLIGVVGDPSKYLAKTQEIVRILEEYSDRLEMASVDEGYLDVTGSLTLFKTDGAGLARRMRDRIADELGLPCSVGVAPNKLLAKLASGMKKPMGVTEIRPERAAEVLEGLPVSEMPGIGAKLSAQLRSFGIRTCGQLGRAPLDLLQDRFGFWGWWMGRWGRGEDDSPVARAGQAAQAKSVGHSTTLPADTTDPELMRSFILLLSEKVAARLRRGGLMGKTVSLTVRTDDFKTTTRSRTLAEHQYDGLAVAELACAILRESPPSRPVRLLGVSVSGLVESGPPPYLLGPMERSRRAVRVMDALNGKFGRRTLRRAGEMPAERFGLLEAPVPPTMHRF